MLFSVRDLELKPIRFDQTYAAGEIDFLEEGLTQVGPLSAKGEAELQESVGEIEVRGELHMRLASECDRCLERAEFGIDRQFDLCYQPTETLETGVEVALKTGDTELGFFEGEGVVLEEILREQVLLALPVQRLCREDCKGLCPACGANWNQGACACAPKPDQPVPDKTGNWAAAWKEIKPRA